MDNVDMGEQSQRLYLIEVLQRGSPIAFHTVTAPDALTAINQVERLYGEPVILEETSGEGEEGQGHSFILARNWHGYMFHARAL